MIARFGSMERAKSDILGHWQQCKLHAEQPERINIDGMRKASFEYPSGYAAALAAKAAEHLGGQKGHWDYFDRVQTAHLRDNLNIANHTVLECLAEDMGHNRLRFRELMRSEAVREAVDQDNARAKSIGVLTIPSILVNGTRLISQTLTSEQLTAVLTHLFTESPAGERHETV